MKGRIVTATALSTIIVTALIAVYTLPEFITSRGSPSNSGSLPYAYSESFPLKVSIKLSKTQFFRWETVKVLCTLKNTGDKPVTIRFVEARTGLNKESLESTAYFDLIVIDTSDRVVYRWSKGTLAFFVEVYFTIEPGEEKVNSFLWHQDTGYPEHVPVPAGTYKVSAIMPSGGTKFMFNGQSMTLSTPSIAIIIT